MKIRYTSIALENLDNIAQEAILSVLTPAVFFSTTICVVILCFSKSTCEITPTLLLSW